MAFLLTLLAVITALLALGNAHNIQLRAHSRECFHEELHKDDKMTVTFQVGDREFGASGNLDLDFWVGLNSPVGESTGGAWRQAEEEEASWHSYGHAEERKATRQEKT